MVILDLIIDPAVYDDVSLETINPLTSRFKRLEGRITKASPIKQCFINMMDRFGSFNVSNEEM